MTLLIILMAAVGVWSSIRFRSPIPAIVLLGIAASMLGVQLLTR